MATNDNNEDDKKKKRKETIEQKVRRNSGSKSNAAIKWFLDLVKGEIGRGGRARSSGRRIPDAAFSEKRNGPIIGQMYFYQYDPKLKNSLPWYDSLPMVIPINYYKDGILGLNLHYLPPVARAKLLDKLMEFSSRAGTARAYMRLSYKLLKAIVDSKLYEPCIKRYLYSHIQSNFIKVDNKFWERAAMLPVQEFKKATARKVWGSYGRK
jgi:hypothetical protein